MSMYYIIDIRRDLGRPYITLWRPDNAGYCWPLCWAGLYSKETIEEAHGYYFEREGRKFVRFPVRADLVARIAVAPTPGRIDGDAGPVIPNTNKIRRYLVRNRLRNEVAG
ncbi:hypothetical protein [Asaia sp. VD9]|uniref:hypothetical protein n=1 Tax=Asaia sp. VD9 TaxID=3081235 RepID=UPI00301879AB